VAEPTASVTALKCNSTGIAGSGGVYTVNLNVGGNTIEIEVTAENGAKKTYTVTVTRAQSGNANLNGLLVQDGETELTLTPGFNSGTFLYTLDVENAVGSIKVTPDRADPNASVTVKRNGTPVSGSGGVYTVSLAVYGNAIEVEVTAENGTKQTYTVNVYRAPSDNADLASLRVTGWDLNPAFDKGVSAYTLTVGSSTERIVVHAEAAESNASIEFRIDEIVWSIQGEASASIDLTGQDMAEIIITVTAQDGEHSEAYTIEVSRSSAYSDASLSDLKFDFYDYDEFNDVYFYKGMGFLIPTGIEGNGFTPEHDEYECWNMEGYLTVTPTAASVHAKNIRVTFLGAEGAEISSEGVESGSATEHINTEGLVTVEVEVTAFDGTKVVYTVTRAGAGNADLSWITLSAGSLNEDFSEDRTDYTVDVPHEVSSITVNPIADSPLATVTVNGTVVDRGFDSQEISLDVGSDNEICIEVTALNGVTVKTYTIIVTRAESGESDLSGMMFNQDSPKETFAEDETAADETVTPEFEENQSNEADVDLEVDVDLDADVDLSDDRQLENDSPEVDPQINQ
jgi:hypothetical protein